MSFSDSVYVGGGDINIVVEWPVPGDPYGPVMVALYRQKTFSTISYYALFLGSFEIGIRLNQGSLTMLTERIPSAVVKARSVYAEVSAGPIGMPCFLDVPQDLLFALKLTMLRVIADIVPAE